MGTPGLQGSVGEPGSKGDRGLPGPMGQRGAPGPVGEPGSPGAGGIPGEQGTEGPEGAIGPKGQQGWKGVKGHRGEMGEMGPVGNAGPKGERGPKGPEGPKGVKGDMGKRGPQGPQGIDGSPGPTGPVGSPGPKGEPVSWYWIDANQGSHMDAIKVWCNLTGSQETCIYPNQDYRMIKEQHWDKVGNKFKWFSDLKGGFKIKYVERHLLKFLRLESVEVYQKFKFFCSGSVAWFDQVAKGHDHALVLRGENDHQFKTKDFKIKQIIYDGCRDRRQNGYTEFYIKSRNLYRLPIVDFLPKDYGNPWQMFGFEVGPVCFR
ncbi:hypothetical protein LOTGIDRAFT_168951 [Lottia gigantea]|uniref:Fibrillar collagen NC1 domain-containing protein n=1 Tax=Lottia gigantea TaxID=225164 RepID=V4B5W5_LOTGI|nr:hypothetical protein LOTGIDRAFT_168951 [Lottia gigantea]ESO83909.1 hypothetical protein LOTGIDRAFT_168951 [Lottia gigantea]